MAKKTKKEKDNVVRVSPENLLEELIFPATRYCIGRHSYVSSYAMDYWNIIKANRDVISKHRLLFYAGDIKAEVSNVMNWWDNVRVENAYNDRIVYDAYFLITKYMYEHQDVVFRDYDFVIDCITGNVDVYKRETPLTDSELAWNGLPNHDLSQWSALASRIADTFEITARKEDGGTEKVNVCISYDLVRYYGEEEPHWEKFHDVADSWKRIVPEELIVKETEEQDDDYENDPYTEKILSSMEPE